MISTILRLMKIQEFCLFGKFFSSKWKWKKFAHLRYRKKLRITLCRSRSWKSNNLAIFQETEIDELMSVDSSLHQYAPRMQGSQNCQLMREHPAETSKKEVSRGALYLHMLRSQHEHQQGRSMRTPPQERTPLLFNHWSSHENTL